VGHALAGIHLDAADFAGKRSNSLALQQWHDLLSGCGQDGLRAIDPSLPALVEQSCST
jgi:homoserine kinase type II